MQTFLPYESFTKSAATLDRMRLGKQRVENLQILSVLTRHKYDKTGTIVPVESNAWQNHPAVKMWRGYLGALMEYQSAICDEWTSRGYRDTCKVKSLGLAGTDPCLAYPWWLGNERVHESHRSNLRRKDHTHYDHLFPDTPDDLEYYWPV